MTGTTKLTRAQFETLQATVTSTQNVIDVTIHPRTNHVVGVELKTTWGTLRFRIDHHGKKLIDIGGQTPAA